jgi:hypothetical protein
LLSLPWQQCPSYFPIEARRSRDRLYHFFPSEKDISFFFSLIRCSCCSGIVFEVMASRSDRGVRGTGFVLFVVAFKRFGSI